MPGITRASMRGSGSLPPRGQTGRSQTYPHNHQFHHQCHFGLAGLARCPGTLTIIKTIKIIVNGLEIHNQVYAEEPADGEGS